MRLKDARRFVDLVAVRNRFAHDDPARPEERAERPGEDFEKTLLLLEDANSLTACARRHIEGATP